MENRYAHPEVLVSTDWVSEHGADPNVRLVEVDVDTALYPQGHVRGAVGWSWETELCDLVRREIVDRGRFERMCGSAGVDPSTTVVLYGDSNNWFAAWGFWLFKVYGHPDVRLMNGGRKRWELDGRPYAADVPRFAAATYEAHDPDPTVRAYREDVFGAADTDRIQLVDVRSPDEYTGRVIAPPGMNETAQRGGHIPHAVNVPWALAVNEDGTFKSPDQLRALYDTVGIKADRETIAYCRIGERSSHTWFVLKYLLGFPRVRNYDGSWTEWGNLVGAPISK